MPFEEISPHIERTPALYKEIQRVGRIEGLNLVDETL